jgi:hypothetical protein
LATITPSGRERLRREDPARTAPIRNWSTLYRRSDSWDLREPSERPKAAGDTAGGGSWNDVVSHGVELGYRVIEEQIRQGQRLAEKLNRRSYDRGAMGSDLREVADRVWRYYTDLGGLWVEFLSSFAGDSDLVRRLFGAWQPSNPAATNGATAVSIEVSCARPANVTLDLQPHSEGMRLVCQELRSLDAWKPPLSDVAFEPRPGGRVSLRIRVPEGHPPGTYTGAIIDRDSSDARGTLSVRLT